ncbi:MAG: hypothetical protein MJ078_08140, partial [Clostridia bacterium]|nr:hypothetical protein [Clostridia bacterium]
MGWGKIIGGAVGGFIVGGPLGAIIGASAGAVINSNTENSTGHARSHVNTSPVEKKDSEDEIKKIDDAQKKQAAAIKNVTRETDAVRVQTLIAMVAIGMAAANADCRIKQEEMAELKKAIQEANGDNEKLPEYAVLKIQK